MNKVFKTRDFYVSAVLRAIGYELLSLERQSKQFVIFVFSDPQTAAKQDISNYWDHQLSVDARALVEAINELKTRMYNHE